MVWVLEEVLENVIPDKINQNNSICVWETLEMQGNCQLQKRFYTNEEGNPVAENQKDRKGHCKQCSETNFTGLEMGKCLSCSEEMYRVRTTVPRSFVIAKSNSVEQIYSQWNYLTENFLPNLEIYKNEELIKFNHQQKLNLLHKKNGKKHQRSGSLVTAGSQKKSNENSEHAAKIEEVQANVLQFLLNKVIALIKEEEKFREIHSDFDRAFCQYNITETIEYCLYFSNFHFQFWD